MTYPNLMRTFQKPKRGFSSFAGTSRFLLVLESTHLLPLIKEGYPYNTPYRTKYLPFGDLFPDLLLCVRSFNGKFPPSPTRSLECVPVDDGRTPVTRHTVRHPRADQFKPSPSRPETSLFTDGSLDPILVPSPRVPPPPQDPRS